jgi:hypothetical protein
MPTDPRKTRQQVRATIDTSRLAEISSRLAVLAAEQAQLLSEQANIFSGMSEDSRVLRTGRRAQRAHLPEPREVTDVDRARADVALRKLETRRRERR